MGNPGCTPKASPKPTGRLHHNIGPRPLLRDKPSAFIVLLVVVLAAGCFLRIFRLTGSELWFDEIYSVTVARETDLASLVGWMRLDVHPPLYYLCLSFFLRLFGDGALGARVFSALVGSLTLLAMPWIARDMGMERKAALFAAFLLAFSPLHIYYSQEARMYILLAFEVLIAVAAFYLALGRNRWQDWAVYLVATTAALYTHLYAFLLLPAQALYLLYRLVQKPRLPARTAVCCLITMGVLLSLAIPLFLMSPTWLNSPALGGARIAAPEDLIRAWAVWGSGLAAFPTSGLEMPASPPTQIAGALLLGGLALLGLIPGKRRPDPSPAPLLAATVIIPLLLGILLSWGLQRNIWAEKTLTMMAPLVYLLAGIGAARLTAWQSRTIIIVVFVAISLFSLHFHYFARDRSTVPRIAQSLRRQAQPDDLVVLDPFWYVIEFDYWYREPIQRIGYYYYNGDHFVDLTEGYKGARLISGSVSLKPYTSIWVWGAPEDVPRLCRYNPQADFKYYDLQSKRWQEAKPCPPFP